MQFPRIFLSICSLVLLTACPTEAPEYIYGVEMSAVELSINSPTMGVHPDNSVLVNPDNPFAMGRVGDETKWDIESSGFAIPAFYSWATLLADIPIGESQFYAANALKRGVQNGQIPDDLAFDARSLAVQGFQSVLDNFPDSLSYTAGGFPFRLAPLAYQGMLELGVRPEGWVMVTLPDGSTDVIRVD